MNLYKLENIVQELNIQKQRLLSIVKYDNYKNYIEIDCLDIQEDKISGVVKFIEGVKTIKKAPFSLVLSGEVEIHPQEIIMSQNEIIWNYKKWGQDYVATPTTFLATYDYWTQAQRTKFDKVLKEKFTNRGILEHNNW